MKVLITGATGFIGKNLVEELSKDKSLEILCLVRNYKKAEGLKSLGAKLIYADITREHTLSKILRHKIDIIFHCAGCVDNKNKDKLYKVNVLGTENVCSLAQRLNVERLVYLSSVAVISGNTQVPLKEDLPFKATNIYGESKIEAEKRVLEFRRDGLRSVIIRPCMVYGKGEPHMFNKLCSLLKHRLLPLIDGGKKKLHLVHVKNVVELMIASLKKEEFLEGTFFIADGEALTVKEIFEIITKSINAPPAWNLPLFAKLILLKVPFLGKKVKFFLKDRIYSIERIKNLGFNPPYDVREGLKESVQHLGKIKG